MIIQLHEAISKLVHTILINKVRHKSIINLLHITNMTNLQTDIQYLDLYSLGQGYAIHNGHKMQIPICIPGEPLVYMVEHYCLSYNLIF